MKEILRFCLLISVAVVIAGCMPKNLEAQSPAQYVQNSSEQTALIDQLRHRGILVSQVGDGMTVTIPTDHMFYQDGQVNPRMKPILAAVADLVKTYLPRPVRVVGHSDQVGSYTQRVNRSKSYAYTIASYLWAQNIPLTLMRARGEGDDQPIASDRTVDGSAANRRVDIIVG